MTIAVDGKEKRMIAIDADKLWKAITSKYDEWIELGELGELIYDGEMEVPSVRCKDCKYFERYTDDGTYESVLKMHQWDGECSEWVGHTYMGWFCSRAERRRG